MNANQDTIQEGVKDNVKEQRGQNVSLRSRGVPDRAGLRPALLPLLPSGETAFAASCSEGAGTPPERGPEARAARRDGTAGQSRSRTVSC